jgi:DNA repair exonuclease SbcCD ATPase subunit
LGKTAEICDHNIDPRSKTCCPTCNRPFDNDSDVQNLLEDLESEIKRIPGKVQNLQAKLNRADAKQEKLQSLLPDKKQADQLKLEVGQTVKSLPKLGGLVTETFFYILRKRTSLGRALPLPIPNFV